MSIKGIDWRSVFSSNVTRVGYSYDTNELLVEWTKSGKISAYGPDFPFVKFEELSKAPSVGSMIKNDIIPRFSQHYISLGG